MNLRHFSTIGDRARFGILAATHVLVALIYKYALGVRPPEGAGGEGWSGLWQTLPVEALTGAPLESVWNLHSQPPLYNLYGAVFWNLFGSSTPSRMQDANIVMGALIAGMTYVVAHRLIASRGAAFVVAALIALHPAMFLFEANLLYTLPVTFLALSSVFALTLLQDGKRLRWAVVFVLALNLLILTRSLYHVALLPPAILLVCLASGPVWRKTLALSLLISCLSVGWYAKNYVQHGFFAGSSWGGMSLWNTARYTLPEQELRSLVAAGELDAMVVEVKTFCPPSSYKSYGYDRHSEVASLARNDLHNINIVDVSATYGRNAGRLIRRYPGNYLRRVSMGFRTFCRPSSRHFALEENRERIHAHVELYAGLLFGDSIARFVRESTGGKGDFGSFLLLLYPLAAGVYLFALLRGCRLSGRAWLAYARGEAPMLFAFYLIAYTTAVGCAVSYGENERFKFVIEPLLWAFIVAVAVRSRARSHAPLVPLRAPRIRGGREIEPDFVRYPGDRP